MEKIYLNKLIEFKFDYLENNQKSLFDRKVDLLNEKTEGKISNETKNKLDIESDIYVINKTSSDFKEIKSILKKDNDLYCDELTSAFESFEQKFIEAEEFKMKLLESEINTSVSKTNEYDPMSLKNEIVKDQLLSTLLVGKSKSLNSHKSIKGDKLKELKTSKWSKGVLTNKINDINDFATRGYKLQENINVLKQELKDDYPWEFNKNKMN